MKVIACSFAALALTVLAGCHGTETPPSSPPPPSTAPTVAVPTAANAATPTPPPMPMPAMLPDKDMTHTLSADSPYFTSMPKKDTPPAGTFKAGTKVLVMIPGAPYSQVKSQSQVTAYTVTDNLQPLGK